MPFTKLDPRCVGPLKWTLVVQLGLLCLGVLAMDEGETLRSILCAAVVFWTAVVLIAWRRASKPTAWDLIFLRHGLVVLSLAWWAGSEVLNVH